VAERIFSVKPIYEDEAGGVTSDVAKIICEKLRKRMIPRIILLILL